VNRGVGLCSVPARGDHTRRLSRCRRSASGAAPGVCYFTWTSELLRYTKEFGLNRREQSDASTRQFADEDYAPQTRPGQEFANALRGEKLFYEWSMPI
jgi:hypothetical protein